MGKEIWSGFVKCGFCKGSMEECCCFNPLPVCSNCDEDVRPGQNECPSCGVTFGKVIARGGLDKKVSPFRNFIHRKDRLLSHFARPGELLPLFDSSINNRVPEKSKGRYVCVVGGVSEWSHHSEYGTICDENRLAYEPSTVDLVILIGGADIDPSIYNHTKAELTHTSTWADSRDEEAYAIARENNIPIVGICRGGQFLIAKAGGYLYQHTTGHTGGAHQASTFDGKSFLVTSAHHQMFGMPLPEGAELLAWSSVRLSKEYIVGCNLSDKDAEFYEPDVEPECVWLPNINALAVQWHPEWMHRNDDAVKFHLAMIKKYMGKCIGERSDVRTKISTGKKDE